MHTALVSGWAGSMALYESAGTDTSDPGLNCVQVGVAGTVVLPEFAKERTTVRESPAPTVRISRSSSLPSLASAGDACISSQAKPLFEMPAGLSRDSPSSSLGEPKSSQSGSQSDLLLTNCRSDGCRSECCHFQESVYMGMAMYWHMARIIRDAGVTPESFYVRNVIALPDCTMKCSFPSSLLLLEAVLCDRWEASLSRFGN